MMNVHSLHDFIVHAKAATYVGEGLPAPSCRQGSHDLKFEEGEWAYLDSYFGGRDFIGEEVVYYQGKPVWAMNYYGRILRDDLITPAQAGQVIKASLSRMYSEGRFLGGFEYNHEGFIYRDTNEGDELSFRGHETISYHTETSYELFYHGGLIKDE
ncbi:MAG TPA: DUF5680 domain-containing protein [Anaerolineales bacterium]|nr:DUF5680 domain-containing protein [Anaerolineales bacterium]